MQILLLLRELQRELGLSMIFVTHDIGVAVEVADRIAVMYAGRIVEIGPVRDVIRAPRHPYTIGLLSTRAHGGRLSGKRLPAIAGSPPDLANLPPGCAFAPRCTLAVEACRAAVPDAVALGAEHVARCFRTDATRGVRPAAPANAGADTIAPTPVSERCQTRRSDTSPRPHADPRHQSQHHRRDDGDDRRGRARGGGAGTEIEARHLDDRPGLHRGLLRRGAVPAGPADGDPQRRGRQVPTRTSSPASTTRASTRRGSWPRRRWSASARPPIMRPR